MLRIECDENVRAMKQVTSFVAVLGAALGSAASAQSLPHEFSNGAVADAEELNENFNVLEERINGRQGIYELSLLANGVTPKALVPIEHSVFVELCGDIAGCTARLCYSFFNDPTASAGDLAECDDLLHIAYDEASGKWKAGELGSGLSTTASDNNGAVSDLLTHSACAITDGESYNPILAVQDNAPGFGLVNNANIETAGLTCSLVLSD